MSKIQCKIKNASEEGTVIFAAAGNSGGNERVAYPADQDEVICVGSSDGRGNKSSFTPMRTGSESNWRFITLGERVISAWPGTSPDESRIRSGTSYATPIAAAIAGAVLDFMIFKLWVENEGSHPRRLLRKFKLSSKKAMRMILSKMARRTPGGYYYIVPWKLFHNYSQNKSENIRQTLMDILEIV